jgi:hypothetical protein
VRWNAGTAADGLDSRAVPVASHTDWPELNVLILVVNDARKDTASTLGMQNSVATSELLKVCAGRRRGWVALVVCVRVHGNLSSVLRAGAL